MINWSGRRKSLMILLFTGPMLLGLIVFNVYPILFSFFISLTNRNRFRPFPDCNMILNRLLEPTCWGISKQTQTGLGRPYSLQSPIYQNYADLIGQFFTGGSFLNLLRIVAVIVPLIVAQQVNKRMGRRLDRPVSSGVVWLAGFIGMLAVALIVNLGNAYNTLINSGDFVGVIVQTVLYVAIRVPLTVVVAMLLALILNSSKLPGRTAFRVILFVPWAASSLSILIALIWQFFFREQGTINQFLALFGIEGPAYLNQNWWAFFAIVITDIWFSYPFMMIIILGALQSIPGEQYEAAEIDGASWMQQFGAITLPLLRPAILPAIVLTSISAFQMFGTAYAITTGGPTKGAGKPGFTEFVMVYAYKQVFQTQAYGRMGAFAVIIFILLFAATLYSLRITRITKGAYE